MIKISIEQLLSGLNKISGIVDRKNSRPILSNCLFHFDEKKLFISATDLEVSAKVCLDINAKEKGEFCVNTKQLLDIIREIPSGEVELILDSPNNTLQIKFKEATFSIVTADVKEYPALNFEKPNFNFSFTGLELTHIIEKVSYAMSNDETRIFLNGIFIHQSEGALKAVAIDGHRLAMVELKDHKVANNAILEGGILIPRKGVTELKRMAADAVQSAITIYADQNYLTVTCGEDEISIRLITREYPKYQTVIPSKCSMSFTADRQDFLGSVKRVRLLSNEQTQGIKLHLKDNFLELTSSHSALGFAKEKINVNFQGQETEISLNARYLIDVLNVLESNEIIVEFNNSQSPLVIKSKELPNYLSIIMPLRL